MAHKQASAREITGATPVNTLTTSRTGNEGGKEEGKNGGNQLQTSDFKKYSSPC